MVVMPKDQLLRLKNLAPKVLPSPIWTVLHKLKINEKKQTRLGSRGGRRRCEGNVKTIPVIVTVRPYNCTTSSLQQHPSNVTTFPNLKYCSEDNANRKSLKLFCFKARSVGNKTLAVGNFITSSNIDIYTITESWLPNHISPALLNELIPDGFKFIYEPRSVR